MTARAKVDELLVSLKRIADSVGENATVQERIAVLRASVAPIKLLGHLTGELGASEATVVAAPSFKRMLAVILEALREHPTARQAVIDALEREQRGGSSQEAA